MPSIKVVNLAGQVVGDLDLPDNVFAAKVRTGLVHQAIVTQLAGRRRGTASTKTKAEVRGGGKKPFRQKGTGNARQGSSRSPLMPGGGENFGPRPRNYFKVFPKKMAAAAMRSVLSDKLQGQKLVVVDSLALATPKTKDAAAAVQKLGLKKALFVDADNKNLELAVRNLRSQKFLPLAGVNVFDLVNHEWVVFSRSAVLALGARLEPGKRSKSAAKSERR